MRRVVALVALMAIGGLTVSLVAIQQPAAMVVEVQKLRENFFLLTGGGGNTAVFVHADGVTLVDTKLPGWGAPVLARIREITPKPVVRIINTHTHGDHVSGNVEFPQSVDIVVHANTRDNMKTMTPAAGVTQTAPPRNIFREHGNRGLPTQVYTDTLTIGGGPDRIELRHFGSGHTNGDTWVFFPALNIAHAGDIFPGRMMPVMDSNNGGTAVGYADTLMKAHAALGSVNAIVTGHSTVMAPADLEEFAEYIREFVGAVDAGKRSGQSVEQISAAWTPSAKFAGYPVAQPTRVRANTELAFRELK